MLKYHTPLNVREPFSQYSHGVEIAPGGRIFMTSGQLAITSDDEIPESAGDQTKLIFKNISIILASADMSLKDVVRLNAYVTERAYMKDYMAVRDQLFPQPAPASTLMIVSGFTRPEFKVEIEATAAQ